MSRQDQRRVSVVIDAVPTGVWDQKSGGLADSEETKFKPGGMAQEIALGGSQTMENLTVARLFDLSRDLGVVKSWAARRGKANVVAVEQFLDPDGNAFGAPITYQGKLKSVQIPEHDSESSDPAMVELEITLTSPIA
jgi:hypothetical protein